MGCLILIIAQAASEGWVLLQLWTSRRRGGLRAPTMALGNDGSYHSGTHCHQWLRSQAPGSEFSRNTIQFTEASHHLKTQYCGVQCLMPSVLIDVCWNILWGSVITSQDYPWNTSLLFCLASSEQEALSHLCSPESVLLACHAGALLLLPGHLNP